MKYWPWYLALGIIVFAVATAVIIGDRLSDQTLAFMAGVIFGAVVGLAVGAGIGWLAKGQRPPERAYTPPQPSFIMLPQHSYSAAPAGAQPATPQVVSAAPSASAPGVRREFTTIGEEEEITYYESDIIR